MEVFNINLIMSKAQKIKLYDYSANRKLSYRRGTARRFVSLNILLSHSSSFEMIMLTIVCEVLLLKLCVFYRFWYVQRQRMEWPGNRG